MSFAVIKLAGAQFKVSEGETLLVNKLDNKPGDKIKLTDVLLHADGDKVQVGTPLVSKVVVEAEVLDQIKGEKLDIIKFKAKARYRRKIGFRPLLTKLKINKIYASSGEEKKEEAAATVKPVKERKVKK